MIAPFSVLTFLAGLAHAQFPVTPTDLHVIDSELNSDVKISYKQHDLCETTPGVRSFSGFVHLPRSALDDLAVDFDINTFFLFFEARNDPENAPLVIYFAGGPGEASSYSAFSSEGGPCYVNLNGNSTTLNPWSFNNYANTLYIDQPVSAGFSYTSLVNATFDLVNEVITPPHAYNGNIPEDSIIFKQGTYPDPSPWATTNTSVSAARAVWHFAEHWLTQFPEYKTTNKKVGIWGNSAGGFWASATGALLDRNIKASSGSPISEWSLDHIGLVNGALDWEHEFPYWPEFVYNNTYEPFISEEVYLSAEQNFTKEGGCHDLINQCRVLAQEGDPDATGLNETVNAACVNTTILCSTDVGSTVYYAKSYLNQQWTQQALGVPLNFTYVSTTVINAYTLGQNGGPPAGTGDGFRVNRTNIEYLLNNAVKVAIINGDRDSRCPWKAAETFALDVDYPGHDGYNQAGYEYITTNDSYQGGAVRQFENLSFSRIIQAGHFVNAYQPETAYKIFERIFLGLDIATGLKDARSGYSTEGPASTLEMFNESLPESPTTCMVFGAFQEASPWEEIFALVRSQSANGTSGTGASGDNSQGGNGTTSMSVRVQPGSLFTVPILVAAGLSYIL